MSRSLDQAIRGAGRMSLREQVSLAFSLSLPAILSQLSTIVMEYIDASMVGSLGAEASASIGLIATTTWMFGGICVSVSSGFSVQVAHLFGAGKRAEANDVLRQAFIASLIFGLLLMVVGVSISGRLPQWLGGNSDINTDASLYFLVFACALPIHILYVLMAAMLRCSGNMKVPSIVSAALCLLDVVFNFFFIFPSRAINIGGAEFLCPGLGMGVLGAALGTLSAWIVGFGVMLYYLLRRSKGKERSHGYSDEKLSAKGLETSGFQNQDASSTPPLQLTFKGKLLPTTRVLKKALVIGMPIGLERIISCGAQIMSTIIVAPLGTVAIAANSFGITIESLCYMPGYGIGDAATTLIGQSIGAKRQDLVRRFSYITLALGVGIMSALAVLMYIAAPDLMALMTPDLDVQRLTTDVLRIEAFAEPLYAASIICYGIFVGTGETLIPSFIQLGSIWVVRISLAAVLATSLGLKGVWIAMAIELCVRGAVLLIRLIKKINPKN